MPVAAQATDLQIAAAADRIAQPSRPVDVRQRRQAPLSAGGVGSYRPETTGLLLRCVKMLLQFAATSSI
jgi:hypothetical protein